MLHTIFDFSREEHDAIVCLIKLVRMEPAPPAVRANYDHLIEKFERGDYLTDFDIQALRVIIDHSSRKLEEKLK